MDTKEDMKEDIEAKCDEPVDSDLMAVLTGDFQDMLINNTAEEVAVDEPKIQGIQRKAIKEQRLSLKKERRDNPVASEVEKIMSTLLRTSLKSQLQAINRLIDSEESKLLVLQRLLVVNQRCYDSDLLENNRKAENASIGIQQARDTELELDVLNEALIEERNSIESELELIEGFLSLYTSCKDILFKMSSVEWQETQTALEKGKKTEKFPGSVDEGDNYPALFTSAPKDLLDVMTTLTEQNVSLIRNAPNVDNTLEELNQSTEETSAKMKEVEEKVTLQIRNLRERVDVIKTSTTKLKQRVILHDSLKTVSEDLMLNALGEKVAETYSQCMDRRPQNFLSTQEMVAHIESRMCTLLDQLESVPKDFVERIMKIKECERRNRQQEDKLRLNRQKCLQRILKDPPRKRGRKLMPRCIPVESHAKEEEETVSAEEDEFEVFLFDTKNHE